VFHAVLRSGHAGFKDIAVQGLDEVLNPAKKFAVIELGEFPDSEPDSRCSGTGTIAISQPFIASASLTALTLLSS
jgi:hypothetical protein